jgi:hypothetical protein
MSIANSLYLGKQKICIEKLSMHKNPNTHTCNELKT